MANFAARQELTGTTSEDVAKLAATPVDGSQRVGAYWTPDDGQVLSIFASEEGTAPQLHGDVAALFPVQPITAEEYGPAGMTPAAGEGDGLQLVLVHRNLGPQVAGDFRAVALQAIMCAYEYTDLLWLRSYWDMERNQLHCLFRTRTHDLVREHARRSRIPCDEVHDAIELTGS